MNSIRRTLGSARRRIIASMRTGDPVSRAVYYRFVSDAFRREQRLVTSGHKRYLALVAEGKHELLLRRNIHMLEKGLTMRPRRNSFGAAYAVETVDLLARIRDQSPTVIDEKVTNWAREVLDRFVAATADSDDPDVQRARNAYLALGWGDEGDKLSGPMAPSMGPAPVDIDSLLALAERRKSVRWFDGRPVPREAVDRALRVAGESPSACNRQPFTFRIFDDPDMVKEVARIPMGTAGYGHNLPAIAVIVGDLSAFIDERDRHLIYTDGCLAAMSFILGLESQGIASVCINWPDIAERDRRMSRLLRLSAHERTVMLIGFGYADPQGETPYSAKRPLQSLRSYNSL